MAGGPPPAEIAGEGEEVSLPGVGCRDRIRTGDLQVMSQTRYRLRYPAETKNPGVSQGAICLSCGLAVPARFGSQTQGVGDRTPNQPQALA